MLLEPERKYGLVINALAIVCSWNPSASKGLVMEALVTVCSWNPNASMDWS